MMFDELCIDKILNNDKTVTRRLYRKNGHRPAVPGKIHKLKIDRTAKTYGNILILDCEKEILHYDNITLEEAHKEGFQTKEEFMNYWSDINNMRDFYVYTDGLPVWRVEFKLL